jgi:hypothetical protein
MIHRSLLLLVVAIPQWCVSQNTVLVRADGLDPDPLFSLNDTAQWEDRLRYNIHPAPQEIVDAVPLDIDYSEAADRMLKSFQLEHLTYGRVIPGCAFLAMGNYAALDAVRSASWKDATRNAGIIKDALLARPGLLQLVYDWLVPLYKRAFARMSLPEQREILASLGSTRKYTATFNIKKEKHDLDSLGTRFARSKGKLNAFVFRRITNGEMTMEACLGWIDRIVRDFTSILRDAPTEADEYILTARINSNYYTCGRYGVIPDGHVGWGAFRDQQVLRRGEGPSEVLPEIWFDEVTFRSEGIVVGERQEGSELLTRFFLCDSLASKSFSTTCLRHSFVIDRLGHGPDERLLVQFTVPQDQGNAWGFTLVDVDSAKVVLDNVYFGAEELEDVHAPDGSLALKFPIIFTEAASGALGVLNKQGQVLLAAQYGSIMRGVGRNEYILNAQQRIRLE